MCAYPLRERSQAGYIPKSNIPDWDTERSRKVSGAKHEAQI